jgi:hypothetical protein
MDEPAGAARPGVGEHARVYQGTAAKKEGGSFIAELKNQIGLRPVRLRRLKFVREQFFPAAAQNIKRPVRFLSQGPRSILPTTTY